MTHAIWADFRKPPYDHQLREFEEHGADPARALLWSLRTGKTKAIIDQACHLFKEGEIDGVVVMAPNGVHDNWVERELPAHHWDTVPYEALAWNTAAAKKASWGPRVDRALAAKGLTWISLANETMIREDARSLVKKLFASRKKLMAVFDESHDFRTPGSKRSKMARAMAKAARYRRILTGTSVENSPLHAWSQFELLKPGALGYERFGDFKNRYAVYESRRNRQGRMFPKLTEYRNLEELKGRMAAFSSTVLRSDCEDLPDLIRKRRDVEMTEKQADLYRDLTNDFEVELRGEELSVGALASKLIKLQQVGSNFVRDEDGKTWVVDPDSDPRMEALLEEAALVSGKVIVWCAFHRDMDMVSAALRGKGYEVLEYHGRTSSEDKAKARAAFAPGAENDVKALVGYPTPGLNLSEAEKIINYSHTFDAIKRSQGNERATEMGGEAVVMVDLSSTPTDRYILDAIDEKTSIADALVRDGERALESIKL